MTTKSNSSNHQELRFRAARLSFMIGLLMLVMKVGGYIITNSAAILSDAMESVVHVIATGFALYSIILISRPADKRYPYGYGKAEYFSAGLEGSLIIVAAVAICYAAILDIIHGSQLRSLDIGVIVVAAAGGINLWLGLHLIRVGKRTNSLLLVADGKHVLTDSYTSIGVLVGLLMVRITDIKLLDPIFAIAVALNILWTGYHLARESVGGLMNTANQDTLERTVAAMNRIRTSQMIDMHRLRAWRSGDRNFIDFHLTLPYYLHLKETHTIQDQIHSELNKEFQGEVELLLHLDPCIPTCCHFCDQPDCRVRSVEEDLHREFNVVDAQGEPAHIVLGTGAKPKES